MSSAKRGEPVPVLANGPFYSRYTEHKQVSNPQSPEDTVQPSRVFFSDHFTTPTRNNSIDIVFRSNTQEFPFQKLRSGSVDRPLLSPGNTYPEFHLNSKTNNSDRPLSPGKKGTPEFLAYSPNLYDNPLSTFRTSSAESSRSVSPFSTGSVDLAKERRNAFVEKNTVVNNSKSKGKFTSIISKHAVTIFAAATLKFAHEKVRKKHTLTHSCPDLISPSSKKPSELQKKEKTHSFCELSSLSSEGKTSQTSVSENKLKVPDIFTTSFTHSKGSNSTVLSKQVSINASSLQDIQEASKKSDHKYLRRATSLNKPEDQEYGNELTLPAKMYRDDHVAQITDYMFIGSIESAYNERRLCRLEIESLVDISNVNEMQVPSQKKTQCPCLCQTEFKHFRSRLIIAVADEENDGIDQYFEEVNRFIQGARRCSKKVLLYSYDGKSRAALFAIQYLMSYEGLLLRQAYNLVKKQRPQVMMNPGFQRTLENLEKTMFPDEKHSVNICNEYLNVADPQAIKCAWIDC